MFKKRLDCKWLGALILMLASVGASALAGLRSETWSVTPSDYRYDMSLYFSLASKDYENLDLYEVGAFFGEECRGLAEKLDLPDNESCLYMRIRSNSAHGETLTFLMRNKLTGETITLKNKDTESFTFKADQMVGLPSEPYLLTPYFQVNIYAEENGSVEFENGLYPEGATLNITAIPDKGYHFDSWNDGNKDAERVLTVKGNIDLTATFAVNVHTATFIIEGETFASLDIAFGTPIDAPVPPLREGYTFAGWNDLPETMPDHDIEITGNYNINTYKAIFKIGDETVATLDLEFGVTISAPEAPEKEGYTFAGWSELPETMPAHDIEVNGSYNVNSYKAVFKIRDETIATIEVEFGATITAPDAPEKEGYTFAGWSELPETMPAHDIEVNGSYNVNSYKAVFKIGDEVIETIEVEFGAKITAPEVPEKEGYTFSGWSELPETMPAHDIEINGSYEVNSYRLIVYINDDIYMDVELEYGADIIIPDPELPSTMEFNGWNDEIPATMPAHDVEIHGTATEKVSSAISVIFDEDSTLTIFNINGVLLYKDIKPDDIKDRLTAGVYIISGKKVLIK